MDLRLVECNAGPDQWSSQGLDWIVFADDWGRHPSTTQHLVRALPRTDKVVWVDSLGMRSPRLRRRDALRLLGKMARQVSAPASLLMPEPLGAWRFRHVKPLVLPFHRDDRAVRLNRRLLSRAVGRAATDLELSDPIALVANPVAINYLSPLGLKRSVYLRLDDYASMPGVDAALIRETEPRMIRHAELVVGTSRPLVPQTTTATLYLPPGVDVAQFQSVPLKPPQTRTIGYCGSIAEWLDFGLVGEVARQLPKWRFEFVGPRVSGIDIPALPANVRVLPPAPYSELPQRMASWRAAWSPFKPLPHITQCSPLKLREYLAAGLPVASTPYPAAAGLAPHVALVGSAGDVLEWVASVVTTDDRGARQARRDSQQDSGWAERMATLCRRLQDTTPGEPPGRAEVRNILHSVG